MNISKSFAAVAVICSLWATPSHAFSISSGVTPGCHERITINAFREFVLDLPVDYITVPESETWRDLAVYLVDLAGLGEYAISDAHRFMLLSLMIGVRSPDTDGHSVFDLVSLRKLHSDPDDEGQYAHALRGLGDDGWDGNVAAHEGVRKVIWDRMESANTLIRKASFEQNTTGTIYLDFYGRITVPVYGPAFYLGQAAHALQDSFAHTLRSENYRTILHFMNYVEAISDHHHEERDGMAHSDSMDACDTGGPERMDSATMATIDLLVAARERFSDKDPQAVVHVLDKWIVLQEDTRCELDNQYCDAPMLSHAREKQTAPYLESIVGCSIRGGAGQPQPKGTPLWMWFIPLVFVVIIRPIVAREVPWERTPDH